MTQVAFLATKINKEQQPHQKIFSKTPLQWQLYKPTCMSEGCEAL